MDDLEKANKRLEEQVKEAKRVILGYRKFHDSAANKSCTCHYCLKADEWLARNKSQ